MQASTTSGGGEDRLRFGPDFELEVRARRLCRAGRPLKLERIPSEILLLLLEHHHEIVTREQIVERVWGAGVSLDTDNGIRGGIRKIRQTLKDDAEQPRFIQTVTGHGYRFIAPVIGSGAQRPAQAPDPRDVLRPDRDDGNLTPAATFFRRRVVQVGFTAAVLLAAGAAFLLVRFPPRVPSSSARSMLAVLPFENLTGDANQEYFSDGLTDELIARIGRADPERIGVIARTSVLHFKRGEQPLDQIAHELGVQYVLEGSVRGTVNRMRITAQVIQLRDQTHLWTREYDREFGNVLALQDEIAQDVAGEIQAALGQRPVRRQATSGPPAPSPGTVEAHDLYLRGRFFWNQRTPHAFERSIDLFQQAIIKAPAYAPAHAGLADSYALMSGYSLIPQSELMPKARAAASRALALDDDLAEAHTSLAEIAQNYDWDFATAERQYRRAIELTSNYATAHHWYGELLGFLGRFDEAFAEFGRARELDPLSLIISTDYGATLLFAHQYDRAADQFRRVLAVDPNFSRAAMVIYADVHRGHYQEAIAEAEARRAMNDTPWDWALLAYAYGRSGQTGQGRSALAKLEELNRRQRMDPAPMVVAYLGVGDMDRAFFALDQAIEQRSASVIALRVDPLYDDLRSDPRFKDLLRRVRLDP